MCSRCGAWSFHLLLCSPPPGGWDRKPQHSTKGWWTCLPGNNRKHTPSSSAGWGANYPSQPSGHPIIDPYEMPTSPSQRTRGVSHKTNNILLHHVFVSCYFIYLFIYLLSLFSFFLHSVPCLALTFILESCLKKTRVLAHIRNTCTGPFCLIVLILYLELSIPVVEYPHLSWTASFSDSSSPLRHRREPDLR